MTLVCVDKEQSVLGLRVGVISLIGTCPRSFSPSPSVISLLMMLFSAIASLSPSPAICPNILPVHSFSISFLLSVPFHFTLVFSSSLSVISSKHTGNRGIDCRERSRPGRQDEKEREEMRKPVALTQNHTDHSLLTAHMHTFLWLIGLTAFTLRER